MFAGNAAPRGGGGAAYVADFPATSLPELWATGAPSPLPTPLPSLLPSVARPPPTSRAAS